MKRNVLLFLGAWCVLPAGLAVAEVKPASLFQDHMVLQRDRALTVWGTAAPGEKVTVSFGSQSVAGAAGDDGTWSVVLKPLKASATPATLTVGDKKINDVLVGEVWLCSGQSNMRWPVSRSKDAAMETGDAKNHPTIRLCEVAQALSVVEPRDSVGVKWKLCDPKTVGRFSAVAYFFGRELSEALDVPIGLVHSSWDASPAEAWTSRSALETLPFMEDVLKRNDADIRQFEQEKGHTNIRDRNRPSILYNGMIHPLIPFGIRGVIWYQGEANGPRSENYDALMRALITDWRKRFGQGDLPFYYVQLASYRMPQTAPFQMEAFPFLREAQAKTLGLKNTGMASAVDLADAGKPWNIHPSNKQDVGKRLSLWALAKDYGLKDVVCSGPIYKSMKVSGGKAILSFDHLGGGLTVKKGEDLKGFGMTADGRKWVWADAKIDGDTVVCTAEGIETPKAVCYGWADSPIGNLYNKAGLPAVPFRTNAPR